MVQHRGSIRAWCMYVHNLICMYLSVRWVKIPMTTNCSMLLVGSSGDTEMLHLRLELVCAATLEQTQLP